MSRIPALVHLSVPGTETTAATYRTLDFWAGVFASHVGEDRVSEVDSVAGWGCLNQDWIAVDCEVETSWGWCRPTCLDEAEWDTLRGALHRGDLIMTVDYRTVDGGLEPHC